MATLVKTGQEKTPMNNPARITEHLANERTFLAWMRTGMAVVIFGFAIGRFAIAIREFLRVEGQPQRAGGISVWFGVVSIGSGVALVVAGLHRYRRGRIQIDTGTFEPAGLIIDLVAAISAAFGLALMAYLMYIR